MPRRAVFFLICLMARPSLSLAQEDLTSVFANSVWVALSSLTKDPFGSSFPSKTMRRSLCPFA